MLEISAAMSAMRAAIDFTKIAVEARDDAKIKTAMGGMAERFMDLQLKALSMADTLLNLQKQLSDALAKNEDIEKQISKRALHVLTEVRPGAYVYAYNPLPGEHGAAHYKCQICFDAGQDSVLVRAEDKSGMSCNVNRQHGFTLPGQYFNGVFHAAG